MLSQAADLVKGCEVEMDLAGLPDDGSPTVWVDEEDGSIVIQGWKIADERTMSEITAAKPVPDHETVVRVPARMATFLMEACGGGATGVRPVSRG